MNIGEACVIIAVRAGKEYLRANNLTSSDEALIIAVRAECKRALPGALADAKEALACHMDQVAESTFAASMAIAGIQAAKLAQQPA